jgi:CheY-like chemotaxis protein
MQKKRPGLSGHERLGGHPRKGADDLSNLETSTIPVVMLSARAGEESVVAGLDTGADDHVVKPFSARELISPVATHLELARLRHNVATAVRAGSNAGRPARRTRTQAIRCPRPPLASTCAKFGSNSGHSEAEESRSEGARGGRGDRLLAALGDGADAGSTHAKAATEGFSARGPRLESPSAPRILGFSTPQLRSK